MIPVGHLADRWGTKAFLVSGFALAAVSLFTLATYGNSSNVWFIVAFAGFSYALIQPAWNSLLAGAIPPNQRGVLMGLFMSVEGLGFAIGPALGGLLGTIRGDLGLVGKVNANTPFYVSGIFLLIMALVYLIHPFRMYQ
jgi:MFS family permease